MKTLMQNLLELQTLEFAESQNARNTARAAELRGLIPPQILGHYDRLRVRGKKGLAAVNHQVCAGCHMQVPLGAIMTLKHHQDIQLCESCGRYLYLPEEAADAPPTSPPVAKLVRVPRSRKKTTPKV
jgi:predicted  nucleic acid-binding Zn-ribbon protein